MRLILHTLTLQVMRLILHTLALQVMRLILHTLTLHHLTLYLHAPDVARTLRDAPRLHVIITHAHPHPCTPPLMHTMHTRLLALAHCTLPFRTLDIVHTNTLSLKRTRCAPHFTHIQASVGVAGGGRARLRGIHDSKRREARGGGEATKG
jgi:hypothetical protein